MLQDEKTCEPKSQTMRNSMGIKSVRVEWQSGHKTPYLK